MDQEMTKSFITSFRQAPKEERILLLSAEVEESPSAMGNIISILAARDIDTDVFVSVLTEIHEKQPNNLPALYALILHNIRDGNCQKAREMLLECIKLWPSKFDAYKQILRLDIVEPTISIGNFLKLARPVLEDPLVAGSYRYQLALAHLDVDAEDRRRFALREMDIGVADAFRSSLEADSAISAGSCQNFWDIFAPILKAKRIALIGNGPSLLGQGRGAEIDGHDLVVRFNFPHISDFAVDVGRRTDLVMVNESILGSLPSLVEREAGFHSCGILSAHPDSIKIDGIDNFEESLGVKVGRLPSGFRKFIRRISYGSPTTGFMAVILFGIMLKKELSIYGFDFFNNTRNPHYFKRVDNVFLGHELSYEKFFVRTFLVDFLRGMPVHFYC